MISSENKPFLSLIGRKLFNWGALASEGGSTDRGQYLDKASPLASTGITSPYAINLIPKTKITTTKQVSSKKD